MIDPLIFEANSRPTLGIEIELGLVHERTCELASGVQQVMARLPEEYEALVKPELMQCCVELNSGVCHTVDEIRDDLSSKLTILERVTDELGLRLWWGGTHPFSTYHDQEITPDSRYLKLVDLLQEMARQLVTFGLHIHVGVDSGDKAVMICDRISEHLPTLLALSANSPFWEGHDTGLQSHRSKIMEGLPTAGLPMLMRNWSEYVWLVNHLIETDFINSVRELWWDVRPHHRFGTIEIRICDMPGNLDAVLSLAALVQALVKSLSDQIDRGLYSQTFHPMFVRQNKWRACRYGNKARLVNAYTFEAQTIDSIVADLVVRLRPQAEELGCWDYLQRAQFYAEATGWSDQQRQILADTLEPREIVRRMTQSSRLTPHSVHV